MTKPTPKDWIKSLPKFPKEWKKNEIPFDKPTPCEHGKDKSWCVKCNRGEPENPTPEEKCIQCGCPLLEDEATLCLLCRDREEL